jgi:xanthine dehydrogenase YagT iron-sulfur-binding subunit
MNDDAESTQLTADLRRRELLKASVATGGAMAAAPLLSAAAPAQPKATWPPTPVPVVLHVNGAQHEMSLDPRTTLLDALREHLQLTGSKKGCGLGQCGACTVLIVVPVARRTRAGT